MSDKILQILIESVVTDIITKETVLLESKQSIINLGFPEIVAKIIQEKFGSNAFLVARWNKEYFAPRGEYGYAKNWWRFNHSGNIYGSSLNLPEMIDLYNAADTSQEAYDAKLKEYGFDESEQDLKRAKEMWKEEIEKNLFKQVFFRKELIKDIVSGKIKNLAPYKKLSIYDAVMKYDEKRIFTPEQIVKEYPNGYKWINVGARCELVGAKMKNCGSAGVMSTDKDRTMLVLFDGNNNPHAMVTYSPNENRISGDEGQASSALKDEYHDYILDLAKHLDANFDANKSKSQALRIKGILGDKLKKVYAVKRPSLYTSEYFKIKLNNGEEYYTDTRVAIPAKELKKSGSLHDSIQKAIKSINYREPIVSYVWLSDL